GDWRNLERHAHQGSRQRAGDLTLRPDDIRPEQRPPVGSVIPKPEQEDLGFVFEEELAGQAEEQAEHEHGAEDRDPSFHGCLADWIRRLLQKRGDEMNKKAWTDPAGPLRS